MRLIEIILLENMCEPTHNFLFIIYINDLEINKKSNMKFFADDTMLFSIVNDPALSANNLNHDLRLLQQ